MTQPDNAAALGPHAPVTPPDHPAVDLPLETGRVRAVVFDLGNVLVDLDPASYGKTWPAGLATEPVGRMSPTEFAAWERERQLFYAYETGRVDTAAFVDALATRLALPPRRIVAYWNSILLDIPLRRLACLPVLRERYPLYVLSNTNELHIAGVRRHLAAKGVRDFERRYFTEVFYSYELGAVKPEPEIYATAEARIGLAPEHLLFLDDRAENVAAAQACGWQAVWVR